MTSFVYDGTAVPDGKSDLRPLTGTPSKYVTAAEWNTVMQALEDLRSAILAGNYHGLVSDPAAPVSPAVGVRLRNNLGTLEVSQNGAAYAPITGAAATYDGYFTATGIGVLQSNTASQNSDAIEAWLANDVPRYESAVLQFDVSSDTEAYAFARTIVLQKPVTLRGGGPGGRSTYASYLTFPADTTGIQIKSSGGVAPNFRGDNVLIEDLVLVSLGSSTTGYGVLMQGRAKLENLWITNFGSHGCAVIASTGDTPSTNANIFWLERVASTSNKGHGIYIDGADANAGTIISCDASSNLGWGFYDASFLGNTFIGCHTDANILGSYYVDDVNARSMFLGCYHEGGQPLPDMGASRSMWLGGLVEGRIDGGAFVSTDGITNTLSARAAGLNRYSSTQVITLGSAPAESLQAYMRMVTTEDGSNPQMILHFDKTNKVHEFIWYSTAGSQSDGVRIASLNTENSTRHVPPGMWTLPSGYFLGTQRVDSGAAVPSSARLWRPGDIRWNNATTAGAPTGWVCTAIGMAGSYSEGRTATADGTAVIILNSASSVLKVGDTISCNGTVGAAITKIGEFASGTVTCASVQAGDTVTVLGTVFTAVAGAATLGTATFSKDTSDTATAASLALQVLNHLDAYGVTDLYDVIGTSSAFGVCTITAKAKGTTGNTYGLVSSNGTRLAVSGAGTLTNGNDGTKVTLDATVPAGAGLAISYSAASFAEFGHCNGGIPNASGSPGAATQNTRRGIVAIAAAASSVVVTNSKVTATSVIHATLQFVDATLTQILTVVPGSGSFTITGNAAATANTKVCWTLEE